jgi:hypothetical protein
MPDRNLLVEVNVAYHHGGRGYPRVWSCGDHPVAQIYYLSLSAKGDIAFLYMRWIFLNRKRKLYYRAAFAPIVHLLFDVNTACDGS